MLKHTIAQLLALCMAFNTVLVPAAAQPGLSVPAFTTQEAGNPASASSAEVGTDPEESGEPAGQSAGPEAASAEEEAEAATASDAEPSGYQPSGIIPGRVKNSAALLRGTIPASYDSRDHHSIPEVRNQWPYDVSWAFAAITAAEVSTAEREGEEADYSEGALEYFAYCHPVDPLGLTTGDRTSTYGDYKELKGNSKLAAFTFGAGIGPADEAVAPYSGLKKGYSNAVAYQDKITFSGARWYNTANRALIKQAIMEYGVVCAALYWNDRYLNRTSDGTYYYQTYDLTSDETGGNHSVSIVGWDDSIETGNFKNEPSSKGAWLVRNCRGSSWGDGGYFWLSYCDCSLQDVCSMDFVSEEDGWDRVYFYDGTAMMAVDKMEKNKAYANVFRAANDEILDAVSIGFISANVPYSLQIYRKNSPMTSATDGTAVFSTPVTGTTGASGVYTITLPGTVSLNKGEYFSVAFTVSASDCYIFADHNTYYQGVTYTNHCEQGQTFVGSEDKCSEKTTWRIRALTRDGYRISYELNGGKNSSANPSSYTGKTAVVLKKPTRTGYTFAGWYTDENCTGSRVTEITAGSTGNKTFYAKWTANTYTIKYKANGGTGTMTSQTGRKYGTPYTLSANSFKRTGYVFSGWNTKADGSGTAYKNKASVKSLSSKAGGTVTLYARWVSVKTKYQITYVLNGGKNSKENPSVYQPAAAVTLKNPTRTGYTFAGWYTQEGFSGSKVTKIAKGSLGKKTFYAKWTANTYSIRYKANGGTGTMTSQTGRKYGTSYTLSANSFKRTGYVFSGWNTKADGSGTAYKNKASVKSLSSKAGGTVTLYAQWVSVKTKYQITYVLNGGKNSKENPSVYQPAAAVTLKNPTRTGYTFAGWYTQKGFSGSKVTKIAKGSLGKKTFYAKWTANTYTIKYKANGGTGTMTSQTGRKYGTSYTLSANSFKRTGYVFSGWNTKADGSGTAYKNKASVKSLSSKAGGTVTLYAQWVSEKTKYQITYVLNGGKNSKENPTVYQPAAAVTLKNPTRTGYTFAGWYTKKDFSGSKVTKIAKGSLGKKTFYAKWTANP